MNSSKDFALAVGTYNTIEKNIECDLLVSHYYSTNDVLDSIKKRYSLIDIHRDDIFLTLANTGEIVSVNTLLQELDKARASPFPGADFIKTFKEEFPDKSFITAYKEFLSDHEI